MSDEPHVIRSVDWKSVLPFTLIFRSFRVAVHPSKLVLALLALLLIYVGGRTMDSVWPNGSRAVQKEVDIYVGTRGEADPAKAFTEARDDMKQTTEQDYKNELVKIGKPNGDLNDIKYAIVQDRNNAEKHARDTFDPDKVSAPADKVKARHDRDQAIFEIYNEASARWNRASAFEGVGLFESFFQNQLGEGNGLFRDVREGQWIGRGGVFDAFVNFLFVGPSWAFRYHPVYFTIFGIYVLIIWSIFGGAISRIAAVQVTRDEKISFRQSLSFSTAKFLSFVSAPIIPMLIVVCIGLVLTLAAFVIFNIPFFGPIIGGAIFCLALAAGFVMTLVLLGLLGGFNLMYPTIAVEGSDSFDAISRSFSYLYARPWRLLFYSVVAIIYGTFCYVFVRYFILLMLSLTHHFVGLGVFRHADNTAPLWPMMWPDPLTSTRLSYHTDPLLLSGGQSIGAMLLAFWIYLTIAVLGAFAISFYFSASTIIYVLMRREVDATELDDVYLEQSDKDFVDVSVTSETVITTTTTEPPPSEPPPATT